MHQPTLFRRCPAVSRSTSLIACLSVLGLALGLFLNACKTVDLSDNINTPTDTAVGTATLRISNRIDQDPRKLAFLLFPGNSVDFTNAANAKLLGDVDTGATVAFQVPVGTWKIASKDTTNVLEPMVDAHSPAQEWLQSTFTKGGDYTLTLTSEGNLTLWTPSYTTVPPMSSN